MAFSALALLLLALGAALVVLALVRSPRDAVRTLSREKTVAALYQDRLEELRRELAGAQSASEDAAELETELGASLLSDYEALTGEVPAEAGSGPIGTGWLPGLAGAAFLLISSIGVYLAVGDPQAMAISGAEVVLELDGREDAAALAGWRERLAERVDARPGDARSWYLLGHADLKLAHFAAAAEAFAMAHQVVGEDPGVDLYWLQARYMAAGGRLDETTRGIADRVLARNPNQPMVLEIFALDAYQRGEFRESVGLLNRALSGDLEAGHRSALTVGFEEARKQLGDTPPAVDVAIAAGAEVPAGATLFVIARPPGGGMPLAVVRRPAGILPRTIRLDDAVSMNPAVPLSGALAVEVVVRLSRAGTAMAHPGDWEWHSEPLSLDGLAAPLSLEALLLPPG